MAPEPWPDLIIMWEIFQVFQQCFFPHGPVNSISVDIEDLVQPLHFDLFFSWSKTAKQRKEIVEEDGCTTAPLIKLNQILGQDDEFYAFSRGNAMSI